VATAKLVLAAAAQSRPSAPPQRFVDESAASTEIDSPDRPLSRPSGRQKPKAVKLGIW